MSLNTSDETNVAKNEDNCDENQIKENNVITEEKRNQNETQTVQMCIRNGCYNHAVNNPEWEQEFCSNNCVILHCRSVFMAWVKANEINTH